MQKIAQDLLQKGYAKIALNPDEIQKIFMCFSSAEQFFSLSSGDKGQYRFKSDVEGYRQIGAEFSLSEDRPDLCEAYGLVLGNVPVTTKQGWEESNNLYRSLLDVSRYYTPKINELFEALRLQVNPEGAALEVGETSYLQMNYYRPSAESRDFLQDHHEDGHLLTVVKALEPGLEIRPGDQFEPVTLNQDEILVMPGSLLSIMTGGLVPALWHRVRNTHSQNNRASMMFFVNPDLVNTPKPWNSNLTNMNEDLASACVDRSIAFGLEPINTAV